MKLQFTWHFLETVDLRKFLELSVLALFSTKNSHSQTKLEPLSNKAILSNSTKTQQTFILLR